MFKPFHTAILLFLLLITPALRAQTVDPYDQSKVPLEVDTTDTSLTKIVLVAGHKSHGPGEHEFFAGCAVLMNLLKQTPGVFPVMARDGWPKNEKIFDNAKSIVFYADGGAGHPLIQGDRLTSFQKYIDRGVGFACLHYAVEYPKQKANPTILKWLGGYYETDYSINPVWKADFKSLPDSPVTRGINPFTIRDEWYYNMRWADRSDGISYILKATPPDSTRRTASTKEHPGREEIEAWTFDRPDGGRSFGFTGGHYHKNWGDENFRRLVTNAILWTAKIEVPSVGAKVDLDPADLNKNLDDKGTRKQ
jgi:type 1 glutamine amidotransferase